MATARLDKLAARANHFHSRIVQRDRRNLGDAKEAGDTGGGGAPL
jgi:hypothetical protein